MITPTPMELIKGCYYIDLGTGSMIIQIAIAGLFTGLFMLKAFWGKVIVFLKKFLSRGRNG